MLRASSAIIVPLVLGWAAQSHAASVAASAGASLTVTDGGGVQVVSPVEVTAGALAGSLPATLTPVSAPLTTTAGTVSGSASVGYGQLTVYTEAPAVGSAVIPENMTLIRSGGSGGMTFDNSAQYGVAGRGIVLGGALINGDALSVNVGATLSLASSSSTVSPYSGLMVVMVQYN